MNTEAQAAVTELEPEQRPVRRPAAVTWLTEGVLILAGLYLVRVVLAVKDWEFLRCLAGVSPAYVAATGALWAVLLGLTSVGLGMGKSWAYWLVQVTLPLFALYFWLDRLVLYRPYGTGGEDPARPFLAGATVLILLFLFLTITRKKTKAYFGVLHERRP